MEAQFRSFRLQSTAEAAAEYRGQETEADGGEREPEGETELFDVDQPGIEGHDERFGLIELVGVLRPMETLLDPFVEKDSQAARSAEKRAEREDANEGEWNRVESFDAMDAEDDQQSQQGEQGRGDEQQKHHVVSDAFRVVVKVARRVLVRG